MAEYCRTLFGDMLLTEPLEKFPVSGFHCRTLGPEGWGTVQGAGLRRQVSSEDVWVHLGRLWGWDPVIYHVRHCAGLRSYGSDTGAVPSPQMAYLLMGRHSN